MTGLYLFGFVVGTITTALLCIGLHAHAKRGPIPWLLRVVPAAVLMYHFLMFLSLPQ